ncbi:hypothetical protein GQ43DRAFT_111652 [Delitschia confertaspora ATCC 74209]|uniref:Uncharacterized protein n=1 Tax=Delitschia confertaspora ATCC 74209 TaxID=1513339 RepID=A0A9P4JHM1_9PLEO|nr:hypothetical protein GQ43DRAFT_111652 [Delitschia confertaspora ATCC 74209]
MSKPLTSRELISLIEAKRKSFSEEYVPLLDVQLEILREYLAFIALDRNSIQRNHLKKRSHIILNQIWRCNQEIFVLCALTTNRTRLGSIKETDYISLLLNWWSSVDHPNGLKEIVKRHPDIFTLASPASIPDKQTTTVNELLPHLSQKRQLSSLEDDKQQAKRHRTFEIPSTQRAEAIFGMVILFMQIEG